jgi:hypothetical protein
MLPTRRPGLCIQCATAMFERRGAEGSASSDALSELHEDLCALTVELSGAHAGA